MRYHRRHVPWSHRGSAPGQGLDRAWDHQRRHRTKFVVMETVETQVEIRSLQERDKTRSGLKHLFNFFGPFFGLLLVLGLFSLSSEVRPVLFTGANFKIILIQTVIV